VAYADDDRGASRQLIFEPTTFRLLGATLTGP
jgi:hypothetical protein